MFNLGLLIWLRNSNKISDAFESETLVRIWLCCVHICSFWWHKTRCFDLLANSCQKAQMLIEWCHSGFEYFSHISFYCDHLISKLHWKLLSHCVCVLLCLRWMMYVLWVITNESPRIQTNIQMVHKLYVLRALSTKRMIYTLFIWVCHCESVCCWFGFLVLFRFHTAVLFAHSIPYFYSRLQKCLFYLFINSIWEHTHTHSFSVCMCIHCNV